MLFTYICFSWKQLVNCKLYHCVSDRDRPLLRQEFPDRRPIGATPLRSRTGHRYHRVIKA